MPAPARIFIGALAAALALAVGAAALASVPGWLNGGSSPGAYAPDTLLLVGSSANTLPAPALTGIGVFRPETGLLEPLLDTPAEPLPAPDGRDLFVVQEHEVGDQQRAAVVDLASDTLRPRWTVDIVSRPLRELRAQPDSQIVRLAATRDRVYVALTRAQVPEPITLVALDRVDGFQRRRWQAGVADHALGALQLHASAGDGRGSSSWRWTLGRLVAPIHRRANWSCSVSAFPTAKRKRLP